MGGLLEILSDERWELHRWEELESQIGGCKTTAVQVGEGRWG